MAGMPRRYIDYPDVYAGWNHVSSMGAYMSYAGTILFLFIMFAMVKAIVPRYRYDQLMRLGWKIFLPTSLVAVLIVSGYVVYLGVQS